MRYTLQPGHYFSKHIVIQSNQLRQRELRYKTVSCMCEYNKVKMKKLKLEHQFELYCSAKTILYQCISRIHFERLSYVPVVIFTG